MASPTVAANAYANLARMLEIRRRRQGRPRRRRPVLRRGAEGRRRQRAWRPARKSDAQTVAMASGKANVMDVVTAVAETDVAVSTLVSVRDRVIQSYEDIMKMPI